MTSDFYIYVHNINEIPLSFINDMDVKMFEMYIFLGFFFIIQCIFIFLCVHIPFYSLSLIIHDIHVYFSPSEFLPSMRVPFPLHDTAIQSLIYDIYMYGYNYRM